MYLGSSFSTSFLKPYFATPCNRISKLHPFCSSWHLEYSVKWQEIIIAYIFRWYNFENTLPTSSQQCVFSSCAETSLLFSPKAGTIFSIFSKLLLCCCYYNYPFTKLLTQWSQFQTCVRLSCVISDITLCNHVNTFFSITVNDETWCS